MPTKVLEDSRVVCSFLTFFFWHIGTDKKISSCLKRDAITPVFKFLSFEDKKNAKLTSQYFSKYRRNIWKALVKTDVIFDETYI